jgi:hypothetical protein
MNWRCRSWRIKSLYLQSSQGESLLTSSIGSVRDWIWSSLGKREWPIGVLELTVHSEKALEEEEQEFMERVRRKQGRLQYNRRNADA